MRETPIICHSVWQHRGLGSHGGPDNHRAGGQTNRRHERKLTFKLKQEINKRQLAAETKHERGYEYPAGGALGNQEHRGQTQDYNSRIQELKHQNSTETEHKLKLSTT